MKTTFYIVLNMKTGAGFESFGRFFIGNDRDFAYNLYARLKGKEAVSSDDLLHMDLMETRDGLPVNVNVIDCTLKEFTENCGLITKEIFKLMNLEK